MTLGSRRVLWLALVLVSVAAGIRVNTPGLGIGGQASQVRLVLQATIIGLATVLAVLYPAHLRRAASHHVAQLLLLFCALAVTSTLWSPDPLRTIAQSLTALGMVVIVMMHAHVLGWQPTRALLTRAFVAILVLGTLVDLTTESDIARWAGVAGAATQLAQFAVITATLALLGWIRRCETSRFTGLVVLMCLGEIIMSQSRVALITLLLVAIWALWVRLPGTIRPAAAVGLAATVATCTLILVNQVRQLVLRDDAEASDLTEFTGRTSIWPEGIDAFLERPIAGFGFASGETVWADRVLLGHLNWYPSNAHNIALEALLSLGLIGSALLAGFFISVFATRHTSRVLVIVVLALGATEAMIHFASPAIAALALSAAIAPSVGDRGQARLFTSSRYSDVGAR